MQKSLSSPEFPSIEGVIEEWLFEGLKMKITHPLILNGHKNCA